jgi:flagella basal body P-ring formation protein FlgA
MMRALLTLVLSLVLAGAATAAPVLKSEVVVTAAVVTVGDMFTDAGSFAEQPLFRAPAPGTSGVVSVEAVRQAAALIGLTAFASGDVLRVRVSRDATVVDQAALTALIATDLGNRGIVSPGITAETSYDQQGLTFNAEAVDPPARLVNLRYMPGNGTFAARFLIAGYDTPIDLTGHIELMVEAPHLVGTLRAGTVLQASDIEMKPVPLRYAESAGYAEEQDVIGKALVRQTRGGTALRAVDVTEPEMITRNQPVTIYFRDGPMTLSVKGQSLGGAAEGEPVQVLNLMSKKVLSAVAVGPGAVEIANTTAVAGL